MVHYLLIGSDELKGTLNNFFEKNLKIRISKKLVCTLYFIDIIHMFEELHINFFKHNK